MFSPLHLNLVILTGAGISAESGIRTFRAADGLWEDHRVEDVATPEGFARDPELVHRFYNARRSQLKDPAVQPNDAHGALVRLERAWVGEFLLVTQNVDDLHERAGSERLLHMHGALKRARCVRCDEGFPWQADLQVDTPCPRCGAVGGVRPDVVWFSEEPYHLGVIGQALAAADLFLAIGTSGLVYPAAGFARMAWRAHRIEINLGDTDVSRDFQENRIGPASREVTRLVNEWLND